MADTGRECTSLPPTAPLQRTRADDPSPTATGRLFLSPALTGLSPSLLLPRPVFTSHSRSLISSSIALPYPQTRPSRRRCPRTRSRTPSRESTVSRPHLPLCPSSPSPVLLFLGAHIVLGWVWVGYNQLSRERWTLLGQRSSRSRWYVREMGRNGMGWGVWHVMPMRPELR